MTRGKGRTQGYRPQESELRPGKVIVPFGEKTTICIPCQRHQHQACWAFTAAIGIGGEAGCPCGCHNPADAYYPTPEAIDDMAKHGTLAEFVKLQRAWALGSGPLHYGDPCPRCHLTEASKPGQGGLFT